MELGDTLYAKVTILSDRGSSEHSTPGSVLLAYKPLPPTIENDSA